MNDYFVVDIEMTSCSLDESDPFKFMSTESLLESNGSNLHGCIRLFPNQNSSLDLVCTSARQ